MKSLNPGVELSDTDEYADIPAALPEHLSTFRATMSETGNIRARVAEAK